MNRTTREINQITATIIGLSAKLLFFALVFFLLYEGAVRGYRLGHEIFYPSAVEAPPGTAREIVIGEKDSASDVAEMLEEEGLIQSRLAFLIQAKLYEYEIEPGTYVFHTSETSKEMLKALDDAAVAARKEKEESGEDDSE